MRLSTDEVSLEVDLNQGGRLSSFNIRGQELLFTQPIGATEWGCYPMAPWAGRVDQGHFTWQEQDVQLPINSKPHALHGTVFNRRWTATSSNSCIIDLGESWPWPGTLESVFKLSDRIFRWTLSLKSLGNSMPVVLGWHPWFRRSLSDTGQAVYGLGASKMYVRNGTGIPTGDLVEPPPGPWDDCFTEVATPPRIQWPGGPTLEITSSCDHWVVYDERDYAFCIEPQSGPPNAFNQSEPDFVKPGASFTHTMSWRWSWD